MTPHCPTPLPLSAIGALALGHKIEAINIVRHENPLSRHEAKEAVEAYERAHPDLHPTQTTKPLDAMSLWLSAMIIFIIAACITWIFLIFSHS